MGTLSGATALVTGASRGIGRAIAVKLAEEGASVAGLDVAEDALRETGRIVEDLGVEFLHLEGDVSHFDEFSAAIEDTTDHFDCLDILVNNAGITRDNLMIRMSEEDWEQVLAVNLTGVFNGIKAVSRTMMKQRRGRIINIASVVGILGNAGQANYAASKGGVIALTKSAARELASRHVTVNAVAPGFITTAMTEKLSQQARQAALEDIPLDRLGEPEEVAGAVAFLAGPAAQYITGQVLCVDGGMAM